VVGTSVVVRFAPEYFNSEQPLFQFVAAAFERPSYYISEKKTGPLARFESLTSQNALKLAGNCVALCRKRGLSGSGSVYRDPKTTRLTDDAAHWYAHITMSTDELRREFRRMRQQNATPADFGLKVRAHPDSLIVTAQNKMRQSRLVERVISISGESLGRRD